VPAVNPKPAEQKQITSVSLLGGSTGEPEDLHHHSFSFDILYSYSYSYSYSYFTSYNLESNFGGRPRATHC
jgi:hypothetical protein